MDHRLIWIFLFCAFVATNGKSCKREPKCRISRVHGMKSADCYQKDLRSIPQCVASDVEILEMSYNRIRKITKNDLSQYTYLKLLYLSDNMIVSIDDDSFANLDDLQTIDLTMNALQKLPPVIFQLPSLKSLYLGQNLNMNIIDAIELTKPISSPLARLDISFLTDDEPIEFPDFGIMPQLVMLNISGNWYMDLTPKLFSGLCNLQYLDNTNATVEEFANNCDCWVINKWLKERKVKFQQFQCDLEEERCFDDVSEEDLATFDKCNEKVQEILLQSRMTKILIICSICAGVVILMLGIYFYIRRSRRNARKPRPEGHNGLLNNRQENEFPSKM